MFNIIISGKKGMETMGIFPYRDHHKIYVNYWGKKLEFSEMFNFVKLKKLKPGSKYVIYVDVYQHFFSKDFGPKYNFFESVDNKLSSNEKLILPDRVKIDSQNGLVHWLINYDTESHQLRKPINFNELCKQLHTIPKNITLISGAETNGKVGENLKKFAKTIGYNIITGYTLYRLLDPESSDPKAHNNYINEKLIKTLNKTQLKYKSLCYNRRPRPHRHVIVAHIIKNNYNSECLYSLGANNGHPFVWDLKQIFPELLPELEDLINSRKHIYPHIREKNVNLDVNQFGISGWNHGLNSYFQFVSETNHSTDDFTFITEKSLKPLAMLQPFIHYGPRYNIKNLQEYGFDTFDDWINHDYDNEEDDIKRLRLVLKEFDRLQNMSHNNWTNMLHDMTPSLLHNLQLVKKSPIRNFSSQLIPILYNFYKK